MEHDRKEEDDGSGSFERNETTDDHGITIQVSIVHKVIDITAISWSPWIYHGKPPEPKGAAQGRGVIFHG